MQDVTIVRWPDERSLREDLAKSGRARLLLVETDAAPPIASDPLEPWARPPCGAPDVRDRMEGLRLRLATPPVLVPALDAAAAIRYAHRCRGRESRWEGVCLYGWFWVVTAQVKTQ